MNGSSVTDNFLLIALIINFAVTSYFDEKVTERIHERKTRELFRHDPEALYKLAQVEEIKRNIFRAEHRGIKLVEEHKEENEKQSENQSKIISIDKLKALRNKIKIANYVDKGRNWLFCGSICFYERVCNNSNYTNQ